MMNTKITTSATWQRRNSSTPIHLRWRSILWRYFPGLGFKMILQIGSHVWRRAIECFYHWSILTYWEVLSPVSIPSMLAKRLIQHLQIRWDPSASQHHAIAKWVVNKYSEANFTNMVKLKVSTWIRNHMNYKAQDEIAYIKMPSQ